MAHIGIDARLTHYRVGGISRYIRGLISAFEQLQPPHTFTIVQSRKSRRRLSARFQSVSAWTPPHHPLERAALSLELARRRFDLLHSPDFIAPLRGGRRHVITVHDLSFIHYPEYITAESRRYYNGQIQTSLRRADHILADSEATKRDLIDILAVPADDISVHMLGVDARFTPQGKAACEPALRALDLPDCYLLFVGTLEPRKNLVGLARAYRELKLEYPDAPKLVIAGRPGWHYDQLMSDLDAVGVSADLLIRESVADAQLPALYSRALALITPSFYEGFGLTALEAMACGTTPIVSRVASLPEIVGDVGLLVDPHDIGSMVEALARALTDSQWRQRQEQAALRRAAGFRWSDTARVALDGYERALN
ncbi:MAG: glycosyltransferase family 4 protein [Chloroflexi bacterium]|nr:glycosyltransferase family 4 protein [Chloroflexota bacterium]